MVGEPAQVVVIGLGNPDRGDDAIGLDIARRLRGHVPDDVRVVEVTGDALTLIDAWDESAVTYVIDAALSGRAPGTVHRIENDDCCVPRDMTRCSGHAFGLAEALELARALGRAPRRLVIYAVEGECFDLGRGLSADVAAAAEAVTQRLLGDIAGHSGH